MKQRLGIAQAMINDPQILVLDEPTAGLDPKERVRFRNLIASFAQDKIVILSTHIVSDVEFIANRILIMRLGSFVMDGSLQQIVAQAAGRVWECHTDARRADAMVAGMSTANVGYTGDGHAFISGYWLVLAAAIIAIHVGAYGTEGWDLPVQVTLGLDNPYPLTLLQAVSIRCNASWVYVIRRVRCCICFRRFIFLHRCLACDLPNLLTTWIAPSVQRESTLGSLRRRASSSQSRGVR